VLRIVLRFLGSVKIWGDVSEESKAGTMLVPLHSMKNLGKLDKVESTWSHVYAVTRNSEVYINSLLGAAQTYHVPQKFNCGSIDGNRTFLEISDR
jgi:acetate kinase